METILLLGIIVALLWLREVSRRTKRVEAEVKALREALASGAPPPAAAEEAAPDEVSDAGEATAAETEPEPVAMDGKPGTAADDQPPPEPRRRRSAADLERLIGARWSVILGGIAVALGAVFLVRYTIEAGLLGPGARTLLGAFLAMALLAGGEWLRRHDKRLDLPVFDRADIPGILTGAGVIAGFATLYAAHALYGFVGPASAFVGLTLIGLASLALSAVHGPKLAAVGLLGAYATPLLVESTTPNPFALVAHVLVVTAAVMTVARLRDWKWLALAGVAGSLVWVFLAIDVRIAAGLWAAVLIVGLAVIYIATFAWQIADMPSPPADRPVDRSAMVALLLLALLFAFHCALGRDFPGVPAGLAVGALMTAGAIRWPALAPAAPIAALVVTVAAFTLHLDLADLPGLYGAADLRQGLVPPDIAGYLGRLAVLAVPVAALAGWGAHRAAPTAPRQAGYLASGLALVAVFVLIGAYGRIAPFETHIGFGVTALVIAAGFVALTAHYMARRPEDWAAPAPAATAVAAVTLVSFAIGVMASKHWAPFGFAVTSLGIAWIHSTRPLRALPLLAVAAALLGAFGIWLNAPFPSEAIGTTPFFNRLLILVGLPAAAVLTGGEILRRNAAGRPAALQTAIGLALAALFVALQLRHWISDGDMTGPAGLADVAVQTMAALGFSMGLQRVARLTSARVYDIASLVAGAASVIMIAAGLLIIANPFLTDNTVGAGRVFNLLMPAYLITGLMAAGVALMARGLRPRWYTLMFAMLAGLLLFAYTTLMTRHGFQGPEVGFWRSTSEAEFWTYSAVWLVLGAVLLGVGLYLQSLPVRMASGALIALTVCKVFLLDMAELTGAWRAFSFIGLGLSLLAIGRFYQRVVLRARITTPSGGNESPTEEA